MKPETALYDYSIVLHIFELLHQGYRCNTIALKLGMPKGTIRHIIQQYKDEQKAFLAGKRKPVHYKWSFDVEPKEVQDYKIMSNYQQNYFNVLISDVFVDAEVNGTRWLRCKRTGKPIIL